MTLGLGAVTSSRRRALAAFFAGGAVLSLAAPLLPAAPDATPLGICAIGGVALVVAAALWRWDHALRDPLLHLLIVLGNVLIAGVVVLAGPGESSAAWAIMFVWAPVFTAAYCSRRAFAGHYASTVLLHGVALVLLGVGPSLATRLLLTSATALVAAAVVGSLVARIRQLAGTDELTGLANRRSFEAELARRVAIARRHDQPLAVAMLDLDGFKQLNDRHGHAHGDQVLREVAEAWRGRLRQGDLLARLGGDEFALLLTDCSLDDARRIGVQLIAATPSHTAASVGVAALGPDQDAADVVHAADQALYVSKRGGGGSVGVPRSVPA